MSDFVKDINVPTNDCISRQAAIDAVHEEFDDCLVWDESGQRTADEFEIIINRLPSAQPRQTCEYWDSESNFCALYRPHAQPERKKGKWIDAVLPNDNGGLPVQVCDQCNTFFH